MNRWEAASGSSAGSRYECSAPNPPCKTTTGTPSPTSLTNKRQPPSVSVASGHMYQTAGADSGARGGAAGQSWSPAITVGCGPARRQPDTIDTTSAHEMRHTLAELSLSFATVAPRLDMRVVTGVPGPWLATRCLLGWVPGSRCFRFQCREADLNCRPRGYEALGLGCLWVTTAEKCYSYGDSSSAVCHCPRQ